MAIGVQASVDSWLYPNRSRLKSGMRIAFGLVWGIDGALKFQPGVVDSFPASVVDGGNGQPAWLHGWFAFWAAQASQNAALWVYLTGVLELALALGLVLGFLRKVTYGLGLALSLVIWAVPEGFGGPYGPTSTDIGTGIVYAFVFLLLMVVNATYGPSQYSLDRLIERRWPRWEKVAEIRGPWVAESVIGGERPTVVPGR